MRTTGIDHTVLHVKDVAKSREFYVDVLGMTINHEDATHAFLWCGGGQMVALFQVGEGTDIKPGDDRCIYFDDPDGHRLQIMYPD